ncbi:MAG: Holliday junction ATP-dependent DNA helicase RuvA [Candidatus Uhrbacteria bacterium GW2011_GWE2_45_35]|uniref:Holliday junction branch migration complex subunit RuvA n=2 Tax=Candidatus Uhriibacteriota TaxID=1752732 RepID=A0A0G1MIQ0_9BACT|nr:MAG: Holliday junction ATP-dependent DNA helicase RuvA [Candidatus Uhrbacteria bacterium GW2011_GWF2_44_350]KKU08943.1 MAG: Holliday junction ATP-dependent DNA helicase RuvA [Candidatus Uhrbacteria bacterium GW2011_GWE2_45_35]HCU32048.1 Holliday junction branch migration protein RuvA [Candidatus Uhrbacteria bacterium]
MITSLRGKIEYHGVGFVVVEVAGVGYKVNLPEDRAHELSGELLLFIHEVQRDDQHELFGFLSMEALGLFWKLTNVSGVGPKVGQKIVFANSVEKVKEKIMKGDLLFLIDIPGVGKKTAQKIILELKGSLVDDQTRPVGLDIDAVEALVGLGYSRRQAEDALVGLEAETTEDFIRAGLKVLSR